MDRPLETPRQEKPIGERSALELVQGIADDSRTLIRKEVELAKQEITEALVARLKAVVLLAVAGVLGLFVIGFGAGAGAAALATVLPTWAGLLIVAGAFGLLAGGAALIGLKNVKRPPMAPEETKRTVKEDVEWAKAQLKR